MTGLPYSSPLYPLWNMLVRLAFFLIVLGLLDQLRHALARVDSLARADSLTGVANGRAFESRAELAIAEMRRSGQPLSFAYIGLDRFKQVNDTYGHSEGDTLLRLVASTIGERLRRTDMVARLGGDEFGVLLPATGASAAHTVVEGLTKAIESTVGERWPVGLTVGLCTFTEPPLTVDEMVRIADALMYVGKREGRGRLLTAVQPDPGEPRSGHSSGEGRP